MTTPISWQHLFKAAFDARDCDAVLDVISMALRADTGDFRNWLATHAADACIALVIEKAQNGSQPPYLDEEFGLPIARRLSDVFQDQDEIPRSAFAFLLRNYAPQKWEAVISECARKFPSD